MDYMLNYSIRNYSGLFGTIRNVMLPIYVTKKHAVLPVTSNKSSTCLFEMQVSCSLYEDVLAPLGVTLYHGLNLTFSFIYIFLNYTSKLLKINELYKFSKNYFAT